MVQTVDREGFLAWVEGFLIKRDRNKCIVAPETHCIAAQDALDRGEKIALTQSGKIVSYVQKKGDGYFEIKADEGE